MTIVQYYRDGRHWAENNIYNPKWEDIELAINQMDNYCFPIVQLNTTENPEDENIFNIIGEKNRWAIFHQMGEWEYSDNSSDEKEVQLWESDQGYFCKEKNVIKDKNILHIYVKEFCDTASYIKLDELMKQKNG